MPAELLTARVTGGHKLQRYLTNAIKGKRIEQVAEDFVRLFPIAILRSRVPNRTGRLADSLRLTSRGAVVELDGIFYSTFSSNRAKIEDEFFRLARQTMQRLNHRGQRPI